MVYYRTADYVIKAALDKGDGIMVALKVPADAARLLALEGGQPSEDLHLTLAYLGKRDEFTPEQFQLLHDIVRDIARMHSPFAVKVTGYDVFPETDDGPCLHATVEKSPALDGLQEDVVEAVSSYGMPPKGKGAVNGAWVPHITLAYGESAPPPETPPVSNLTFDWLRVALGGTEALMRLSGVAVANKDANLLDVSGGKAFRGKPGTVSPYEALLKAGKAVAIDFDGTITLDEKGTENLSMRVMVDELLAQGVRVVIFTARPATDVVKWLREHKWPALEVTDRKSPDFGVYLDDRAVAFSPDMAGRGLARELSGFKTWWEKRAVDKAGEGGWNEADHPREPKGTGEGGQFAGGGPGAAKPDDAPVGDDDQARRAERAREWNKLHPDDQVPIPGEPTPPTPGEDAGVDEDTAARANRWFANHPNEVPEKPGGEAATDRTDEAAAWRVGQPPKVGDTLPGGGKVQPGDIEHPLDGKTWADVPENWKGRARDYFIHDFAARNVGNPAMPDFNTGQLRIRGMQEWDHDLNDVGRMEAAQKMPADQFDDKTSDTAVLAEADRLQAYRAGQGERPNDATLARWRDRGWIGPDTVPQATPDPAADEPSREATPTEVSPEAEDFAPEEWDQLNADQQDQAKVAWVDARFDDAVRDEQDYWRENQAPEDVMNDADWNDKAVKELNEGYYPGDPVAGLDDKGGGTPEQHAEQERRIAEWGGKFAMDESIAAGAFSVDNVAGKLEVDTNKLVFRDNPYAEDTGQQMLPGIDREMMSNAWKASQWHDVKDDFENMYKEAFDKQVADMEPPSNLGDMVREHMDEEWDAMEDKEKFAHADRAGIVVTPKGGGGGEGMPAGTAGTVGPDKGDSPMQKKMQKIVDSDGIADEKNLGGGISTTKIWVAKDGSKYVWKPSTGEADGSTHGRSGIEAGEQYQRETAAYDIGAAVGMKDIMPAVAIVKHEGEYGAMMQMIPNAHNNGNSDDSPADSAHLNTAKRGAVFDYVIGNTDRHGKNWMTDNNGKRWLIDHGLSFSESSEDRPRYGMFDREGWDKSEVIPESLKKPWKGKWAKMKTIMQRRGISDHAIEKVEERYTHMMEDGTTWKDVLDKGDV